MRYFTAGTIILAALFVGAGCATSAPPALPGTAPTTATAPRPASPPASAVVAPPPAAAPAAVPRADAVAPPLPDASGRVTKKPFGIFITPDASPVNFERFRGYHTGVDFETTPAERDADVPVSAICDGKLVMKKTASGYGGVAVESCEIGGGPVTVIYGHVRLSSVTAN